MLGVRVGVKVSVAACATPASITSAKAISSSEPNVTTAMSRKAMRQP